MSTTFNSSQLNVIAKVTVEKTYLVYTDDGGFRHAVLESDWDEAADTDYTNDEHQGYTDWCSDVPAVRDAALARRIIAASDGEIEYLDLGDGVCTRVDLVTGALDRRCKVISIDDREVIVAVLADSEAEDCRAEAVEHVDDLVGGRREVSSVTDQGWADDNRERVLVRIGGLGLA